MIMHKLAVSFQKQKGHTFRSGTYDESAEHSVTLMDTQKLEKAPIHNLAAIDFVNYELSTVRPNNLPVHL